MGKNAYFQIIHEPDKTLLKVFPASKDGEMFQIEEVMKYLELIHAPDYDTVKLNNYLKSGSYDKEYVLFATEIFPENERCIVEIQEEGRCAVARFYPASSKGKKLTRDEIITDLKVSGVIHGIREDVVDAFMKNPEYCQDYVLASATLPVQGHDAQIQYHFDINITARPKLREDGSVDFHDLGNIKPVSKGEKLATLTPADFGKPGIDVLGKPISQNKVTNRSLRHGRNIRKSKDGCELFSKVAGHVTLVDNMVMVSDVYDVAANVDASTGDIEYEGTVNIPGNVNTGYTVKAKGDIVVNGVVEGATLIAGGNIVLKRGMQGMSRGILEAKGNVTAKFIENSKIRCGGTLMCDAVLHSDVECIGEVSVLGKKGLINGGHVRSYANISVTQVGSTMGTSTVVEIMADTNQVKMLAETKEKMIEIEEAIRKIDGALRGMKKAIGSGVKLTPQQSTYLRKAAESKPVLQRQLEEMETQCESLEKIIEMNANVCIKAEGVVNSGVKIMIKNMSRITSDRISACKFVRQGADIKSVGLY